MEEEKYISLVGRAFLYAINTLPFPAIIYGEPHNEAEYLYTVAELINYYTKENTNVTK